MRREQTQIEGYQETNYLGKNNTGVYPQAARQTDRRKGMGLEGKHKKQKRQGSQETSTRQRRKSHTAQTSACWTVELLLRNVG